MYDVNKMAIDRRERYEAIKIVQNRTFTVTDSLRVCASMYLRSTNELFLYLCLLLFCKHCLIFP